jgi:hypothetical protein
MASSYLPDRPTLSIQAHGLFDLPWRKSPTPEFYPGTGQMVSNRPAIDLPASRELQHTDPGLILGHELRHLLPR